MKTIAANRDQLILVDDDDFEALSQHVWSVTRIHGIFYALRNVWKDGKIFETILMHRQLMDCSRGDGTRVDHEDRNGLNNQRYNLRRCTRSQNAANMVNTKQGKSSRYKGVYLDRRRGTYQAEITVNRRKRWLGSFLHEDQAALAYNAAAIAEFGEFARLNVIPSLQRCA